MELGFQVVIVSEIPGFLSWIPDSKAQRSGLHKQKFLRFRNTDYITQRKDPVPLFFFSLTLKWLDDRYIFSLVIIDVLQNGENSSTILDETSRQESAPTIPPKTYPMNKKRHSIHDIPDSAPPLPPRSPVSSRSSLFFSGMFIFFLVSNLIIDCSLFVVNIIVNRYGFFILFL